VTTTDNPEEGPRTLSCEAWEAMLTDALDGTLDVRDGEAFYAHSSGCGAGCAELLEEAKRGTEWLRFLRQTPEAPEGLLEKILAGTTGLPDAQQPLTASGAVALPRQPWMAAPMHMLQRHMAESRILMTLAMAFFSIALTLNLTGVRLTQLKLSDLSPSVLASSVSRQYYATYKDVAQYYGRLRIVYELESRVNEMRHDNNSAPAAQPANPQQQPEPQQKQPPQSSGKPGGSAQKSGGAARREQERGGYEAPVPVLALFHEKALSGAHLRLEMNAHSRIFSSGLVFLFSERPGNHHKPSERSLV
jgi:hypothetical protein